MAHMGSRARWTKLFGEVKGAVVGMIHVQALPGNVITIDLSPCTC